MTAHYRVELTIGNLSWSIERGDAPVFPGGIEVLDGLRIAWTTPETPFWPAQPDPTIVALSLLAESADELNDVDINTPVRLLIYAGIEGTFGGPEVVEVPSVRFVGKVAELTGFPRKAAGVEAWQLDVQCVDLVASLASENIAGFDVEDDEFASPYGWIHGYFLYCGINPPAWGTGGNEHSTLANPLVKMAAATLLEATDSLLARYADAGVVFAGDPHDLTDHSLYDRYGFRRGIIVPNIIAGNVLDEETPYAIEWVSRRSITGVSAPTEPGRLWFDEDDLWSFQITPPPATTWDPFFDAESDVLNTSIAISADYVDYAAVWSRSKFVDPNRVILAAVSGSDWNEPDNWNRLIRTTPRPRPTPYEDVTAQLDNVRVVDPVYARWVGDMYVIDSFDQPNNRYEAQSFVWYASEDPTWPIFRTLFPDNTAVSLWRNGFSAPITITDLPANQSPNGARYYTGTLKGVEWVFDRGQFRIGLTLFPRIPRPARSVSEVTAEPAFTWLGMERLDPEPTWETLNPADTWIDYRLVRPLATDHTMAP